MTPAISHWNQRKGTNLGTVGTNLQLSCLGRSQPKSLPRSFRGILDVKDIVAMFGSGTITLVNVEVHASSRAAKSCRLTYCWRP